jgi:hypothetical protein
MRAVKTHLSDATIRLNLIKAQLLHVSSFDGARNPEASLEHVKQAIVHSNRLQAILDDLRSRYVGAVLAQTKAVELRKGIRKVAK